jgi:molecular chaperone DnaK
MTDPVLGIDLGTTNSVVAVAEPLGVRVLRDADGNSLVPSVVAFGGEGEVHVGYPARERRLLDAKNTIYSVKRLIGRPFVSPEVTRARERFPFTLASGQLTGMTVVEARGETYPLPEISAFVLRKVREIAEAALGRECTRAVVTVPANFNELQRSATKAAARIAGLEVLRILNEPTAAALAYGYGRGAQQRIAVYDFGGGTFDLTVLELSGDVFEVLATAGDTFLGGDDIDVLVADVMAAEALERHRFDARRDAQAYERLRAAAEWAKCQLSSASEVQLKLEELAYDSGGRSLDLSFGFDRAALERLMRPLVQRTFEVCEDAMRVAGVRPTQLSNVILVGGTTRIPLVRAMVREYFGREPLSHIDPDLVVAQGAAIQGLTLAAQARTSVARPSIQLGRVAVKKVKAGEVQEVDLRRPPGPAFADEPARGSGRPGSLRPPAPPRTLPPPTVRPLSVPAAPSRPAPTIPAADSLFEDFEDDAHQARTKPGVSKENVEGYVPPDIEEDLDLTPRPQSVPPPVHDAAPSLPQTARPEPFAAPALVAAPPPPVPAAAPPPAPVPPPLPPVAVRAAGAVVITGSVAVDALKAVPALEATRRPIAPPPLPTSAARAGTPDAAPAVPVPGSTRGAQALDDDGLGWLDLPAPAPAPAPGLPSAAIRAGGLPPGFAPPLSHLPPGSSAAAAAAAAPPIPAWQPLPRILDSEYVVPGSQVETMAAPPPTLQPPGPDLLPLPPGPAPLLLDVTPLSLGIETVGGYCEHVIGRNAAIPVEQRRVFSTGQDGQTEVRVRICQGESRKLADNQELGVIELTGLRAAMRGLVQIEVTFVLDADGTLGVRARDLETGREQTVRVSLVGGLDEAGILSAIARQAKKLVR